MNYFEKPFGALPTGETVWLYHLENNGGIEAEIISYGGIIHRLAVPDRSGDKADVVLGQDNLDGYILNPGCSAAVIGRCANRVSGASFTLGDRAYFLDRNFGSDTLHSGSGNYGGKNFSGKLFEEETKAGVTFYYRDEGTGGFPGAMDFWVTYSLDENGSFEIQYKAIPEQNTVINVTNHAYFNLSGHGSGSVCDHLIQIEADYYLPNDRRGMPTGEILRVTGTDMDFTSLKPFKQGFESRDEQIAQYGGYDHNYCLRGRGFRRAAEIRDPKSGRGMEVSTDLPGVQLYTANNMPDGYPGKEDAVYQKRGAFCVETQHYPNSVNQSQFPSPFYPGKHTFSSATSFRFFTF